MSDVFIQRFTWIIGLYGVSRGLFSSYGPIKAKENRTGDAEMSGGKTDFSPASIFSSSDLRVCCLSLLSNEIEPTRNAAEPLFFTPL